MNNTPEQIEAYNALVEANQTSQAEYNINHNAAGALAVVICNNIKKKEWPHASEHMATLCKKKYSFHTTKVDDRSEIWVYQDGIYLPNGKSIIREYTRETTGLLYSEYLANLVIAKIETDTFIDQDEFFNTNNAEEIAVLNGILNLKTKELGKFTPEKIFFNKINAKYDPEAECKGIDTFLHEVLPDPADVKTIYEMFGYTMWKDNFIERAFMFLGEGRNGKSKTLNILKHFLTVDNITAMPLQTLENGEFKECALLNKLANIAGDISNYPLKETSKLKALTGRDVISAGRKFKTDVTFTSFAKLIFSTNHLPKTYDLSTGFFDRWVYLTFPFTFKEKAEYDKLQKELSDSESKNIKLMDENRINGLLEASEMSGLLNAALDGLDRLHNTGSFTSSSNGEETKKFWIRNSDSFLAFAMENIEADFDSHISKDDLRKGYAKYCRTNRIISEGDRHIKETLIRNYTAADERKGTSGINEMRVWAGIRFKGPIKKF